MEESILNNKYMKDKKEVIYLFVIMDNTEFGVELHKENYEPRLKDDFFSLHKEEEKTEFKDHESVNKLRELIAKHTPLENFITRIKFV